MLFSSTIFIFLFLPCALSGYHLLSRFGRTAMLGWLAATSLVFYAYWNPVYLGLLAASILMNFCFAYGLGEGKPEVWQNDPMDDFEFTEALKRHEVDPAHNPFPSDPQQ